jgi:hypothetical protein
MDARDTSGWFSWLSIFTSAGTLVGLIGVFPQLVWLSERKVPLFIVAGLMLVLAGYFQLRARTAPCPADPAVAEACEKARRVSMNVYRVSVAIFLVGYYFAFMAVAP